MNRTPGSVATHIKESLRAKWSSADVLEQEASRSSPTDADADSGQVRSQAARPRVFFDIDVAGEPIGRLVFELYGDVAPRTTENFRALCACDRGDDLCYRGTAMHRVIPGFVAQVCVCRSTCFSLYAIAATRGAPYCVVSSSAPQRWCEEDNIGQDFFLYLDPSNWTFTIRLPLCRVVI